MNEIRELRQSVPDLPDRGRFGNRMPGSDSYALRRALRLNAGELVQLLADEKGMSDWRRFELSAGCDS